VPSHLYSFSFALNPDWTRLCSPQEEIQAYLERVADEYAVPSHIRFGHELLEAVWNERRRLWEIRTSAGDFTAEILISGMGGLSEPALRRRLRRPHRSGGPQSDAGLHRQARATHQGDRRDRGRDRTPRWVGPMLALRGPIQPLMERGVERDPVPLAESLRLADPRSGSGEVIEQDRCSASPRDRTRPERSIST
jgi:hypothetical protein